MDLLDLGINIGSARGRKPAPLEMMVRRELTLADKDELENPSARQSTTPPLLRLRNTHHMLARCLAEGRPQAEVGLITGYSPSRISILQGDPAFQELIQYYKSQVEGMYLNVHERLAALGVSTIEELQQRLEDEPEGYSNRELMELASLTLDRSVAPPKNKTQGQSQGGTGVAISVNFVQAPEHGLTLDLNPTVTLEFTPDDPPSSD